MHSYFYIYLHLMCTHAVKWWLAPETCFLDFFIVEISVSYQTQETWQCHKTRFSCDDCIMISLKVLALGNLCDECIMIYFKTFNFSKLARILQSQLTPKTIPTCLLIWSTHLQSLMLIDQGNSSYHKKTNVWRPPAHPPRRPPARPPTSSI